MAEGWEELLKSVALPLAQASQWRPHPLPPVSALEKVSKMSAPWETEAQSFQKEGVPTPCPRCLSFSPSCVICYQQGSLGNFPRGTSNQARPGCCEQRLVP